MFLITRNLSPVYKRQLHGKLFGNKFYKILNRSFRDALLVNVEIKKVKWSLVHIEVEKVKMVDN